MVNCDQPIRALLTASDRPKWGIPARIEGVVADYLGLPNQGERMRLCQNGGTGGVTDVTWETGLYRAHLSMEANFGDMDNDGFPNFYLGTGDPSYDAVGPNLDLFVKTPRQPGARWG